MSCIDAFSHTHSLSAVSGAFLQFNSTRLSGSPLEVTLIVGLSWKVNCAHLTLSPVTTEWYNPQGKLVSKDDGDAVNQLQASLVLTAA